MRFCESCGAPLVPGKAFCSQCGTRAPAAPPPSVPTPPPITPPSAASYGGAPLGATNPPITFAPTGSPENRPRRTGLILGVVAIVCASAAVLAAGFLLLRSGDAATSLPPAAAPTLSASALPSTDVSADAGSSADAATSGVSAPSDGLGATAAALPPEPLPPITDVAWHPDYVMIRDFVVQSDGSAIITYDRIQPDTTGQVLGPCRVLTWQRYGERCAFNNSTNERTVGVVAGASIVGPYGTEGISDAGLSGLLVPLSTAVEDATIVSLHVDAGKHVDEINVYVS